MSAFLLICCTNTALAAESIITKHSIKSEVFVEDFNFYVKLPTSYQADSGHSYPTIYLLDNDQYMQLFFEITDILSEGGLTPEFIIVGIKHQHRLRDFTPTALNDLPNTGGADKFLQYIETELIPHITKQYSTNGFKILAGHSMAGLFTLHTMQARPELFNAHFAFSPSLYWDNQTTVKSVKAFSKSRREYHNFLYMNMANEGLDDPYDNSVAMRNGYIELAKYIEQNAPEKFRFAAEHMEQEYHMSTIAVGPFYALRSLYRKFPLPTAKIKQGLEAILLHYQALSAEVGIKITPTQSRMYNAGMYHLWANEDLEKGLEILKHTVAVHPESDSLHDGLAQLYAANGQLNKALQHSEISLKIATPASAGYQNYKRRYEEIKNMIKAD